MNNTESKKLKERVKQIKANCCDCLTSDKCQDWLEWIKINSFAC